MITFIVGAPRTGKTTRGRALAAETGATLVSTDDYLDRPHDERPDAIIGAIRAARGDVVVEGTVAARLLPRAEGGHGAPRPDRVIWRRGDAENDPRYRGLTTWITQLTEAYAATGEPVTQERLDVSDERQRTRQILALTRAAGGRPRPRRRIPAQRPPLAIEASFGREVASVVAGLREELAPLRAALPGLLASASRRDAGERISVAEILAQVRARMLSRLEPERIRASAGRAAAATSEFQKRQFAAQVRAALGVDVLLSDAGIAAAAGDFVAESVATIRGLPTKLAGEVESAVFEAFHTGSTYADVARKIDEILKVGEERAYHIAGQQVAKLNAEITEIRQRNMGVDAFVWRSMRDAKVRPAHRAREGVRYTWNNPPNGETPGNAPGWFPCRCYPEPDFSELLGDL